MDSDKKWIVKTGVIFFCVLLFLTFFSNTIHNFNLPAVSVGFPTSEVIRRTAEGESFAEFTEKDFYYAETAGRIILLVDEGQAVTAGDHLYTLKSDVEDLEDTLETALSNKAKADLKLEKAKADVETIQNELHGLDLEDFQQTDISAPDIGGYDYEMEKISLELKNRESELDGLMILHEAGAVSQSEIMEKQNEIHNLRLAYQQLADQKQKDLNDYRDDLEKAEKNGWKNLEERRKELLKSLDDLKYLMEEYELDRAVGIQSINKLNEQIRVGGATTVRAERSGVIKQIPGEIHSGATIQHSSLIMEIGVSQAPFKTLVSFPESVNYIGVGETVLLNVNSKRLYNLTGTVKKLFYDSGALRAEIEFEADGLTGGERTEIKIEDVSPAYDTVLPNSAVRNDEYGYFILCAEREKSPLGYEFKAKRFDIYVEMRDERNTALRIYSSEKNPPVIINSDKAVSQGDRIRIVGGSDLVETR